MKEKEKSSKIKNLTYEKLKVPEYFSSGTMSDEIIKDVFKYRTHMLPFSANFKENNITEQCKLCKSHPDSQDSLKDCIEMKKMYPNIKGIRKLYEDGNDKEAATLLHKVLKTRKEANLSDEEKVKDESVKGLETDDEDEMC